MKRTARLEVDLDLIVHNYMAVRRALDEGPPASDGRPPKIAAVLKGNAYGLGSLAVAGALLDAGVDLLAVACLPEALELRRRWADAPILVMGHTPDEYLADAARARLRTTLFEASQAEVLSAASTALGLRTPVHLKIDTGMNRLGIRPDAGTARIIARMAQLPGLRLEGIFTHLALRSPGLDAEQFRRFGQVIGEAAAAGVSFPLKHICDSIGMARYPEFRMDLVRTGGILYGVRPLRAPLADAMDLRTPFAFRARLSRVARIGAGEGTGYDESWQAPAGGATIATVPVGYADGYSRSLSNKARAIVRGRRAPVLGLVMMDQLILDVSAIQGAAAGDDVLLLGRAGEDEVAIMELADWIGTNRNEVLCMIGPRVPRVYRRSGRLAGELDYLLDPLARDGGEA
ncbi:MAG: alanine racemase [Holophaga sp.]|jgi:alanine racemase